jgi:hypothetical protein
MFITTSNVVIPSTHKNNVVIPPTYKNFLYILACRTCMFTGAKKSFMQCLVVLAKHWTYENNFDKAKLAKYFKFDRNNFRLNVVRTVSTWDMTLLCLVMQECFRIIYMVVYKCVRLKLWKNVVVWLFPRVSLKWSHGVSTCTILVDENSTEISRTEPRRFLYLTWSNSYFQTNSSSIWNTEHQIRNWNTNKLDVFWLFSTRSPALENLYLFHTISDENDFISNCSSRRDIQLFSF